MPAPRIVPDRPTRLDTERRLIFGNASDRSRSITVATRMTPRAIQCIVACFDLLETAALRVYAINAVSLLAYEKIERARRARHHAAACGSSSAI